MDGCVFVERVVHAKHDVLPFAQSNLGAWHAAVDGCGHRSPPGDANSRLGNTQIDGLTSRGNESATRGRHATNGRAARDEAAEGNPACGRGHACEEPSSGPLDGGPYAIVHALLHGTTPKFRIAMADCASLSPPA